MRARRERVYAKPRPYSGPVARRHLGYSVLDVDLKPRLSCMSEKRAFEYAEVLADESSREALVLCLEFVRYDAQSDRQLDEREVWHQVVAPFAEVSVDVGARSRPSSLV